MKLLMMMRRENWSERRQWPVNLIEISDANRLGTAWPSLACILAMLDRLGSLGAKLPCKEFGLEVLCILRDQVKQ